MNDIVELRQYAMKPGRRDELIELFEREFIESQEALGMHVIGTFRDVDDADSATGERAFAQSGRDGREHGGRGGRDIGTSAICRRFPRFVRARHLQGFEAVDG